MSAKHTPGPWRIFHHNGSPVPGADGHYDGYLKTEIRAGLGHSIYIRQSVAGKAFPELAANAQLIARAPELLEACVAALGFFNETRAGREWEEQGGTEPEQLRAALKGLES